MNDKRPRLIKLFTFERPHALKYRRRSKEHSEDRTELEKMIKEGLVEIGEKDSKYITYYYIEPK